MPFYKIPVLILLLIVSACANAQYYEQVYGGNDDASPVYFHTTPDGGLIIAGNAADTNFVAGYYLLRTDAGGNQLWTRQYSDAFSAYSRSITTYNIESIFLIGSHESASYQSSAEVVQFDSLGNILNSRTYPPLSGWGTSGVGVTCQNDTNISILVYNNGAISNNFFSVYNLQNDLSIRWSDFVGVDDAYTTEHGISSTSDGLYTISYYDNFFYTTPPLFYVTHVRKHDVLGAVSIDSIYEFGCQTTIVTTTADGGALITGQVDTLNQFDIALFRIDSTGQLIWSKRFGTSLEEVSNSVAQTADGGFVVLATVDDSLLPFQHDLLLLKIDANGDSVWSRKFGGTLDEVGLQVGTAGNDIILLGSTTSNGNDRIYVAKTDSLGIIESAYNVQSNKKYLCKGDSAVISLNPSPSANSHILWSNGDTLNSVTTFSTGTFYATITDSAGNVFQTPFTSVYVAIPPDASFGSGTLSICDGTLLRDTASNDITDIYQWYLNGNILPGENLNFITPAQSGNYTLTVKNYCGTDSVTALLDTIYPLPVQPVINTSTSTLVCVGDTVELSITGSIGLTYQWFMDGNTLSAQNDTFYFALANGDYSVLATDVNGCTITSFPHTVTYDDFPEYVNANGPTSFCEGGEITLSVSPGSNYVWSNGDSLRQISVDSSGDYYVTFQDAFGCQKLTDTVSIVVLLRPTINLGNDTTLCSGSDLLLDPGAGYNNYLWSSGISDQTLLLTPTAPFPDTILAAVYVVDSNGCPGADTVRVIFDICAGFTALENSHENVLPNLLHVSESLHVQSRSAFTISFFDELGKCVFISNASTIELSFLKPGMYYYRLVNDHFSSGKIVIQ